MVYISQYFFLALDGRGLEVRVPISCNLSPIREIVGADPCVCPILFVKFA